MTSGHTFCLSNSSHSSVRQYTQRENGCKIIGSLLLIFVLSCVELDMQMSNDVLFYLVLFSSVVYSISQYSSFIVMLQMLNLIFFHFFPNRFDILTLVSCFSFFLFSVNLSENVLPFHRSFLRFLRLLKYFTLCPVVLRQNEMSTFDYTLPGFTLQITDNLGLTRCCRKHHPNRLTAD